MQYILDLLQFSPLMAVLLWTVIAYLLGSVMFSKLLTGWIAGADITRFGDGNPGAHNARLAGGWPLGVASCVLDILKALVPVYLAQKIGGLSGWQMLPVALAPILGHVFSMFNGFHKAKGVAPTLGVWVGLAGLPGLFSFGIAALLVMAVQTEDAWSVMGGLFGLCMYSILIASSLWMTTAALLNWLLLARTHWTNLQHFEWRHPVEDFLPSRRKLS